MTEVDRDIALVLLKHLWERELITEEVYIAACNSKVFDRKNFTPVAESFETEIGESDIADCIERQKETVQTVSFSIQTMREEDEPMAVFRVEKTRNYTVMSNHHLRDKSLSLKAKGLLSLMLSLPEDWDYTTKGLAYICKDGVDSIRTAVRELESAGYIVRQRERHADGTLGGIEYTILEQPREPEPPKRENPVQAENAGDAPKRAFPEQVKPVLGKPEQENPAQLNIEEQSKEELNTDVTKSFPSFPHEGKTIQENGMERREIYRAQIMANVDYNYLVDYTEVDRGRLDELVGLMVDTVCSTKPSIRVAGEELLAEVVRSRLLKLTGAHLLYVLERVRENTTDVRHVKQYLLTALYNAPLTMDNHYTLMVGHDLSGGSG